MAVSGRFCEASSVVWDSKSKHVNAVSVIPRLSGNSVTSSTRSSQLDRRAAIVLGGGDGGVSVASAEADPKSTHCIDGLRTVQTWRRLGEHKGFVSKVMVMDNLVFTCSFDGSIACWRADSSEKKPVTINRAHQGPVHDISVDTENLLLYSVGHDCTLRKWNFHSQSTGLVKVFTEKAYSCELLPCADCIACGLADGAILLIRPSTYEIVGHLEGHLDIVTSIQKAIAFENGAFVASPPAWKDTIVVARGGDGMTPEVEKIVELVPFPELRDSMGKALENPRNTVTLELTRGRPNCIEVLVEDGRRRSVQRGEWQDPAAGHDGKDLPIPILLTTSRDGTAKVWRTVSCECVTTVGQPLLPASGINDLLDTEGSKANRQYCALLVGSGRAFLTGSTDGVIRRWNVWTGELEHEYTGHSGIVFGLARHEETGCLISGSADGTARLWQPCDQCEFCPAACKPDQGCRAEIVVLPHTPCNVKALAGNASIKISWNRPSNDGGVAVTHYEVLVKRIALNDMSGIGIPVLANVEQVAAGLTDWTVGGLTNGCSYSVAVVAVGFQCRGRPTSWLDKVVPLGPPEAPCNFTCKVDSARGVVHLAWTPPATDARSCCAVTGYIVYYQVDQGSPSDIISINTGLRTRVDIGCNGCGLSEENALVAGQLYRFSVAALSAAGESLKTGQQMVMPLAPGCLPSEPQQLDACKAHASHKDRHLQKGSLAEDSTAELRWAAPSHTGSCEILAYQVSIWRCAAVDTDRDNNDRMAGPQVTDEQRGTVPGWKIHVERACQGESCVTLELEPDAETHDPRRDLCIGSGQPPSQFLAVKLETDPQFLYRWTVCAVTRAGCGPAAEVVSFAVEQLAPRLPRGESPDGNGIAKSTKLVARKASAKAGRRMSSSGSLPQLQGRSSGPTVMRMALNYSMNSSSRSSLPRLSKGGAQQ